MNKIGIRVNIDTADRNTELSIPSINIDFLYNNTSHFLYSLSIKIDC